MPTGQLLTRRAFLGSGLAATAGLFRFSDSVVAHGVATEYELSSAEGEVNLGGGHRWTTWMYNQQVPGPVIRARQGERLRVTLANRLAGTPTTLHWHGVPVPNQMDGVPGLTQDAVVPGEDFVYEFDARVSGTYLYHSHVGLQLDRGLAGALVIDPTEPDTAATREVVLLLDDWLPGSPDEALAAMQASASGARGSSNQGHSGASGMPGGGMAGTTVTTEPPYAGLLINGQLGSAANPLHVTRGERIRFRLINACAATTLRVGITGHRMRVTHSDGQAVQPVEVDTLVLGMGERYDVVVDMAESGTWTLLGGSLDAAAPGLALPIVYEGATAGIGAIPVWTPQLQAGRALTYGDLRPMAPTEPLSNAARAIPLTLSQGSAGTWLINGQTLQNAAPLRVGLGERIRLQFRNMSSVRHPMHLHGHFFQLVDSSTGRLSGPIKDTVLVAPMMGAIDAEFTADNPGRWLLHCHHAYHMEAGMARVVEVE